jgi:hypothetical protein
MGYSVFMGKRGGGNIEKHSWSIGFTAHGEIFGKLDHGKYPLLSQMADYHKASVFWGTGMQDLLGEVESFIRDGRSGGVLESLRALVIEAGSKGLPLYGLSDGEQVS